METVSGNPSAVASNGADHTVSKTKAKPNGHATTDRTDSDEDQFFARMARGLLGKDAGYVLHLLTNFEERTCYRYASGERMPPAFLLRKLIRGDHGETWLNALMDGCTAPWWHELQNERNVGKAALGAARK